MAKSKSFFGLRKGSTKTMTYSVLRGQQITKDRVTDIANPRTMDQTVQRIPFAQAVKFYKQATKGLFRFAYEDKRPLESDYNAFMRHNVKYAASVSLDNYNNPNYPALGNFMLSQGSLPSPVVSIDTSQVQLGIGGTVTDVSTVGGVSSLLLSRYPNLAEGDIVTFVAFSTRVSSTGVLLNDVPPAMVLVQFVINTASEDSITDLGFEEVTAPTTVLVWDVLNTTSADAAAVIFSRQTPDGLKVSESFLVGNTIWNGLLTAKQSILQIQGDAYSWGASAKAILQGSLAE